MDNGGQMNRFFVVHLSDLHIRDSITETLDNLIESIASNKELQNNSLVMVITGDIIDRGNYDAYKNTAIEFFKELNSRVQNSNITIADIHIVPGNHDKKTEASNKLFSIAQQTGVKFPNDGKKSHIPSEEEVFELQTTGFADYINLCNDIFKIFNIRSGKTLKKYTESFGVEKTKINSTEIVFIRINTAFSCYGSPGDLEKYHLTVGHYQLDKIVSKYKRLKGKNKNIITLCLAHHPISYMTPEEANDINKYLISKDRLCVDYFLSGHIHDSAITNLSDHTRSMISLETGIGWPDDLSSKGIDHRYAIYCFDESKNIFYTQMFKTNRSNEFVIDSEHLFTEHEKETQKIYSPLKTRNHAYVAINDFDKDHTQYLFVDNNGILMLKSLFSTIRNFSSLCTQLLPNYINQIVGLSLTENPSSLQILEQAQNEFNEKINSVKNNPLISPITNGDDIFSSYLNDIKEIIKNLGCETQCNLFRSYLTHICSSFENQFKDYFNDSFECRAVFRAYCGNGEYRPICAYPPTTTPKKSAITNTTGTPRVYSFENSLIKSSFKNKKSLVYSINRKDHNFIPENWDDFIVIVPTIDIIKERDKKTGRYASFPPLSFVFSVRIKDLSIEQNDSQKNELLKELSYKLLLLQFSEVEDIISTVIEKLLEELPLKLEDFVNYCKTLEGCT